MLNVTNNYKLIDLDIDGEIQIVEIDTSQAWNVFEYQNDNGKTIKISEGDKIQFTVEPTGEIKVGIITKISGSKLKTKIQIMPIGQECEEIWGIVSILENSLVVIENDDDDDDDDDEE